MTGTLNLQDFSYLTNTGFLHILYRPNFEYAPRFIAITGETASGKTTFLEKIKSLHPENSVLYGVDRAKNAINALIDAPAIVLIDELELGLHPIKQRELPTILAQNHPKTQFVFTTNSPMTLLGIPKESFTFLCFKDAKGERQVDYLELDIINMLAGQLLTSPLFGLETVRHISNPPIELLEGGDYYPNLKSRKQLYDELREKAKRFKTNS